MIPLRLAALFCWHHAVNPLASRTRAMLATICLALLIGCQSAPKVEAPDTPLTVLTIGNSFANNAADYLDEISAAAGRPIIIGRANIGGASIERHLNEADKFLADREAPGAKAYGTAAVMDDPLSSTGNRVNLYQALTYRQWDVITVQQVSTLSYKPESFEPGLTRLLEYIHQTNPQARVLLHQVWAYRIDSPRFKAWGIDQQEMHRLVCEAYDLAAEQHGLQQLPVGDAFYLARQTPRWTYRVDPNYDFDHPQVGTLPDQHGSLIVGYGWRKDKKTQEETLGLDPHHAGVAGRYLAGCVWFERLFGDDVRPVNYAPDALTPEEALQLRQVAHEAVRQEDAEPWLVSPPKAGSWRRSSSAR